MLNSPSSISGDGMHIPISRPGKWLTALAMAIGAMILIPMTGLLLGYFLFGESSYSPFQEALYMPYFLLMFVYADIARYLVLNLTVIILVITVLSWAKPSRWAAAWLVASIAAIIFHLIVLANYQPAVVAQPELRMVVATQPLFIEGIVKQAQVGTEVCPCTYHLLGWAADGRFYYKSTCSKVTDAWSIDPATEARPTHATFIPSNLVGQPVVTRDALSYVYAPGVRPENVEPITRSILLVQGESLRSSDGIWLALVSQHVYGPQDVLLIQMVDETRSGNSRSSTY